jgi:threonyl-tRNA synthetase
VRRPSGASARPTAAHVGPSEKTTDELKLAGPRVESNLASDKIGSKIRTATMAKIPYMLIIGDKQATTNTFAVRTRKGDDKGAMPVAEFVRLAREEAAQRAVAQ